MAPKDYQIESLLQPGSNQSDHKVSSTKKNFKLNHLTIQNNPLSLSYWLKMKSITSLLKLIFTPPPPFCKLLTYVLGGCLASFKN